MNGLHPPSEALAGASEGVLSKVTALYAGAGPGSLGLKHIADDLGLQKEVRKPRKKIRCRKREGRAHVVQTVHFLGLCALTAFSKHAWPGGIVKHVTKSKQHQQQLAAVS
jgi:hypothetical protein